MLLQALSCNHNEIHAASYKLRWMCSIEVNFQTIFLQVNPASMQYVLAVFSFFSVVFGGLAVGALVGMVSALILKATKDVRYGGSEQTTVCG